MKITQIKKWKMFSPHNFENTHSVKVGLHATSRQSLHLKSCSIICMKTMVQSLNKYSDCCQILASFTKYFLRYMFLKNAPLSHSQASVLRTETHVWTWISQKPLKIKVCFFHSSLYQSKSASVIWDT